MRDYDPSDPNAPYRALACAVIDQCRKDAQRRPSPGLTVDAFQQETAQWCFAQSDTIVDLCALLGLPHAQMVQEVCR